jgi:hypothetical protein
MALPSAYPKVTTENTKSEFDKKKQTQLAHNRLSFTSKGFLFVNDTGRMVMIVAAARQALNSKTWNDSLEKVMNNPLRATESAERIVRNIPNMCMGFAAVILFRFNHCFH